MKKIISVILAAAMLLSVNSVFAAKYNEEGKYGNDPDYRARVVFAEVIESDLDAGIVKFRDSREDKGDYIFQTNKETIIDTLSLGLDRLGEDNIIATIWHEVNEDGTPVVNNGVVDVWEIDVNVKTLPFTSDTQYDGTSANSNYVANANIELTELGVIQGDPNGEMRVDDNVTRAEMAAIICRMQGITEEPQGEDTVFSDVPAEHWAYGYIQNASELGIINGNGDGTFAPDDYITYAEAVKMVMNILGYEPFARDNGGYPVGYFLAAMRQGVLESLSLSEDDILTRGNVFVLVYNAINAPLMMEISDSDGNVTSYAIMDGNQFPLETLRNTFLETK